MNIIPKSWSKRRAHTKDPVVVDVRLENYKQQYNHICKMHVTYEHGNKATYIARVIYNEPKEEWIVDGGHVAIIMNGEK